jgi:WD40 repeat protein
MVEAARAAMTPLYEQLVLVIEPGMHTARINCVAVDAAERLAVTGSDDKTVRVWSLADGEHMSPGAFAAPVRICTSRRAALISAMPSARAAGSITSTGCS